MIWHWRRRRREARKARQYAEQEKARSQRLRDETHAHVVAPLAAIHARNQFSDIIRDALLIGYEGKTRR